MHRSLHFFFSISIFENVLDQQMLQTKKNFTNCKRQYAHLLRACMYSITFSNSDNNLVVYKPIVKKLATYTHFQSIFPKWFLQSSVTGIFNYN